jgi:hypothetical protein
MRNWFTEPILAWAALLVFCPTAMAQGSGTGYRNTVYDKLEIGPGGPPPERKLTGAWAGPIGGQVGDKPSLTELGQRLFSMNKPEAEYKVSGTNDPFFRTCDPLGFPRNMLFETRAIAFAEMPDRIIVLNQYQRVWREIFTDGSKLPENAGQRGGADSRYYGYSVGRWENDNTLVVDTVGVDPATWMNNAGYPHSVDARFQERFVRLNHNNLELTVTVDDPKLYTKPFVLATNKFKWIPDQRFDEQLCIPSQVLDYIDVVADPAE